MMSPTCTPYENSKSLDTLLATRATGAVPAKGFIGFNIISTGIEDQSYGNCV